jgi:DNA-binding transcriptional MocR family regulator
MSRQPPGVEQAILAEFIGDGHLETFVRATLRIYRERQEALVEAIGVQAKGLLEATATGTGMYLVVWLNPGVDDQAAARAAAREGVDAGPLSTFCMNPAHFRAFANAGKRSAGVFLIPQYLDIGTAIEELLLIWIASDASEWENRLEWLPL